MHRRFLAFASLTALAACAYATDSSVQDVKFVTPGAQGAECRVYVEKVRYVVHPPQTVNLFKSRDDLEVDCLAPGNRRRKIVIEPSNEKSSKWNVANGGVGYAWDYASGALWRYPDVIEVDFTGAPVMDEDLPAHNRLDIRPPEDHMLEEFFPGQPRMNADRYAQPIEILRRQKNTGSAAAPYDGASAFSESPAPGRDKGDLMNAAQPPARSAPANNFPAPLFPGE